MSLSPAYIMRALEGSAKFILQKPDAEKSFDFSAQGFWLSFYAMVVAAPIEFWRFLAQPQLLADLAEAQNQTYTPQPFGTELIVEGLTYIAGWVLFPIVMVYLARLMDVVDRYAPYIIIRNWASLLCYIILVIPTGALYNLGILGVESLFLLTVLPFMIQVWIFWLIARDALQISGVQAVALVAIDFVLFLFVGSLFRAIVYG